MRELHFECPVVGECLVESGSDGRRYCFRQPRLMEKVFPAHRTQNSLRFSLGLFSTEAEVDRVVAVLPGLVEKLRGLTRGVRVSPTLA